MTKRDEAKQDYLAGMKYKEIAEKYGVSESTVKQWKRRYWSDNDVTKTKKVTKKVTQKVTPQKELHPAIQELDDSELNDRQKHFVMEYVRLSNATQAYINAYGVSYKTANVCGPQILVNPSIQNAIKRLHKARMAEQSVGVFDLVDGLIKESKADIRDLVDWGHDDIEVTDEETGQTYIKKKSWVALKNSDQVDSWAVKKVTVGKDGPLIEMHDRNKARDRLLEKLLGKGMFADGDGSHSININMDSFEEEGNDNN
ncbi:terminase small subunit [Fructobacillus fructosus]|uniref:terminase small subunit n=1 Tax=Fructobacillus fructosus TaxID=1631 RepID=UPI002D86ADF7|nr:Uncharacterized conserved protein YjcR [Fructobacillus fructosus]CAK1236163.1 Uncharacterized conserved protein YjcR [Fructobacillus fructosus]CAK1237448.1 Uncharacterized conserved protein YjcR [Fructobacillus fructosus]